MESSISSDIFKFVSLRAPQSYQHEKDVINIIRDNRIRDVFTPDEEAHTVEVDWPKFVRSWVGKSLIEQIVKHLDKTAGMEESIEVDIFKMIKESNQEIAKEIKQQFLAKIYPDLTPEQRPPLSENTGLRHIDEMVVVIGNHTTTDFNKESLISELDQVLRKYDIPGIDFYMGSTNEEASVSPFCADYYNLFDRLYVLYICKRLYSINLEYVMDGLRALHVLLWLNFELDELKKRTGCLLAVPRNISKLPARLFQRKTSLLNVGVKSIDKESEYENNPWAQSIIKTYNVDTSFRLRTRQDLTKVFNAEPFIHPVFAYLLYYYKPFNLIKPVGIGDLKVVKQWLCAYEADEIAHVENVLKGEVKERIHRRLDRTEDLLTTWTEKIEDSEKDLQTTNTHEMQNEVDRTIQESFDLNNRNNIVYKGTVNVDNTLTVAYNRSKEDANRNSTNSAKEITSRSVERIQKRVREERTLRRLFEVEETNRHGFNNEKSSGHVTGIYRFLAKRYKAQVFNYGKRLMFEFVIPEPGAFYLEAFEYLNTTSKLAPSEDEPTEPTAPTHKVDEITEAIVENYRTQYGKVDNMKPYPKTVEDIAYPQIPGIDDLLSEKPIDEINFESTYTLTIPEDKFAQATLKGWITGFDNKGEVKQNQKVRIEYSGIGFSWATKVITDASGKLDPFTVVCDVYSGSPTIRIYTKRIRHLVLDFSIVLKPIHTLDSQVEKWQQDTYANISTAYETAQANYLAEKAKYESKNESLKAQRDGITTRGKNSRINEQIIKDELQKHSITMLAKQFDKNAGDDEIFNAMSSKVVSLGKDEEDKDIEPHTHPVFDINEAKKEGRIVQFLQQAFEWQNIAYILYPYFWAREHEWFKKIGMYDEGLVDPLFGAFLQAGSVRVLVAVRPNYEMPILHYLYTREPWNGGPTPGIYDPLYLPIHEELREQQDDLNKAEPVGTPWEYVLPTTLVYLQQGSELPTYNCDPSQAINK